MGEEYLGIEARPLLAVMPAAAQDAMTALTALFVVKLLIGALWTACSSRRNDGPLILLVAAAATVYLEPFACFMVKAHHPAVGAYVLFGALGVTVPVQLLFFYILYFAPAASFLIHRGRRNVSGPRYWMDVLVILALLFGGEALAIHFGVWFFFDYNPLVLLGLPLWVALTNVATVYAWSAAALYCLERLHGAGRWLAILIAPLVAVAVYGAISLPAAMTLYEEGADYARTGPAAIASALIALAVICVTRPLMTAILSANCTPNACCGTHVNAGRKSA